MTQTNAPDDSKRTIALIYGIMDNGTPFWVFAAVKPSKYQAFLTAYKEGNVDIHDFQPFGEIIVIGEGKSPPDDVTLKVAEMYQTDSDTLMKAMQDEGAPESK